MKRLNVHEAKTHLSRHLVALEEEGEVIVLCRRNVPIAEIRPLPRRLEGPRPVGLAKGTVEVPPEFFQPLPDELLRGFEGEA
jgi:antitoxin (DNA-binding transcriptional repressor) of toxin-antitoxin stability system